MALIWSDSEEAVGTLYCVSQKARNIKATFLQLRQVCTGLIDASVFTFQSSSLFIIILYFYLSFLSPFYVFLALLPFSTSASI